MWRIKRRRTKPKTEGNKVIYPKLNSTAKPNRYQSRNTYLDVKCNKELGAGCTDVGCQNTIDACGNFYSCKTAPYRNPILGYRKHLVDCKPAAKGCGLPLNDVSGNVYKDNYAKTCATHPEACYNQVIQAKQNKNGCVDESYNYSTNQYLNRRCLKFQQQEFNFLSQVPVDNSGCGTKFAVCPNCQLSTETAATSIIVAPTNNSANTLIYTRDGNTWIGLGNDIFSATPATFVKNNGKIWVAGGTTGAGGTSFGLAYSIDGINWTGTQTPPATNVSNISVQNAGYSNNLWMAIADYGSGNYKILSSSNGIDWVIKFSIPDPGFEPSSIEYGNGTWIIFGEKTTGTLDSNVYVSIDEGNSWSFKSTPLNLCSKGFYGDNLWVAVGATSPVGGSAIITSNDNGSTWTQITSFYGNFNGVGSDIFYNGNLWVVVGSQGPGNVSMAYSNDGLVWNAITNPIHNMYSVAWKPGGPWVASSDTTGVSPYYYSDDGITWTASSTNIVNAPQPSSYLGGGISTPFIPANKCICNKNGFCTGINKLPCETKNTKCYAIYKRSNPKFKKQGAVSGGSRINRLKYQTRMKAQGRTVNGKNNVINGRRPATLYRTSKPLTLRDNTCINPPPPPSDLSYETLSGSIIVTWRAGDISKLCRIAPLTGFTIQRTGSPFGHTEPVFGNTYTYSNLPIGSYDIRVRADSYYGSSDWAYLYNIIMSAIPSQILNLTGSVGNEQVQLSWSAPFDGGSPITSYEYKKNNDPWISTGVLSPTSVTITNLTNGTPYTFKVRAVNANGNGPDSNSVSLTPANVPDAPTNLTGIAGAQQVDLSWAAPSNQGGSAITDYKYNVNGGTYISIGSTNTTHNVPGLQNGILYAFKVRAVNAIGDGNESNPISLTPIDVPAAPTALIGTAGAEQVSLSWTPPFDNGSSITDYKYNINSGTYISTGSLDPSTNVTNLTNGTSYTFKVLAVNAVGDGAESSSTSATPTAVPGAPTNLTGTVEEEQVQLSWTAPSNTGGLPITGYKYNINNGTYISTGSVDPSTNVTNLTIGTSYTFKVRVVNATGDGPESSQLTLTTKLFPPYDLSGVPLPGTTNQSILKWKEPASLPSLANGEKISYDIFLNNQNPGPNGTLPGPYPNSFLALYGQQVGFPDINPIGIPNQQLSTNTLASANPCINPGHAAAAPEGVYYFMIRTRKNNASGGEIIGSDYVYNVDPIYTLGAPGGNCP